MMADRSPRSKESLLEASGGKRPLATAEEESSKRTNLGEKPTLADRLKIRRKKLESRYLGLKFIDAEAAEGPLEIRKIEYEEEDAVWIAMCASIHGSDEEIFPYYLNATSGMDAMIEAYRCIYEEEKRTKPTDLEDLEPSSLVGLRIEVCWEITDDDDDDDENDDSIEDVNKQYVWWRAEIVRHLIDEKHILRDGDDEAVLDVYQIRYVARPELGEAEATESTVSFLSKRALLEIHQAGQSTEQILQWRLEGAQDQVANLDQIINADAETSSLLPNLNTAEHAGPTQNAEGDLVLNTNNIDSFVDSILGDLLQNKYMQQFSALDRDKQCSVADYILKAKNKFKSAIHAHIEHKRQNSSEPSNLNNTQLSINSEDMKLILGSLSQDLATNQPFASTRAAF